MFRLLFIIVFGEYQYLKNVYSAIVLYFKMYNDNTI
jgi:hypothetical protein